MEGWAAASSVFYCLCLFTKLSYNNFIFCTLIQFLNYCKFPLYWVDLTTSTKPTLHRRPPLFGLWVSRNSSSPSSPRLITTQVRVRSTRGGFFTGFLGKFWTPSSSSQGSEGHSRHVLLLTGEGGENTLNKRPTWRSEMRTWDTYCSLRYQAELTASPTASWSFSLAWN